MDSSSAPRAGSELTGGLDMDDIIYVVSGLALFVAFGLYGHALRKL